MKNARYIISIAADEEPAIFSKRARDGATVTMITARTFEEATALYEQAARRERGVKAKGVPPGAP